MVIIHEHAVASAVLHGVLCSSAYRICYTVGVSGDDLVEAMSTEHGDGMRAQSENASDFLGEALRDSMEVEILQDDSPTHSLRDQGDIRAPSPAHVEDSPLGTLSLSYKVIGVKYIKFTCESHSASVLPGSLPREGREEFTDGQSSRSHNRSRTRSAGWAHSLIPLILFRLATDRKCQI